jgi:transposase InsO family protein
MLMARVRVAFDRSKGTYGAPRIHADLKSEGLRVGKKRVARLMRHHGLAARRRKRRVRTTDSSHMHAIAPNHLDRQFDVNGVAINRVWASDITYVPTGEGFLFLAVVLDLASRRVVGWSMQETLEASLAVTALRMALSGHFKTGSDGLLMIGAMRPLE